MEWSGSDKLLPPPLKIIHAHDLDSLFNQATRVMALGDFNAKHTSWLNVRNNTNGETIHDYTTNNAIQILGTPTPTYHRANSQSFSYIDIILNKNITNLQDPTTVSEQSSGHDPVIVNWPTRMEPKPGPATWLLKNVD